MCLACKKSCRTSTTLLAGLHMTDIWAESTWAEIGIELPSHALQGMLAELQEQHSIIGGLHHEIENHRRRGHDLVMQVHVVQWPSPS